MLLNYKNNRKHVFKNNSKFCKFVFCCLHLSFKKMAVRMYIYIYIDIDIDIDIDR